MMSVVEDNQQEVEEREIDKNTIKGDNDNVNENSITMAMTSRKEKRKALKKMKRKQVRKEIARKEREEEEARLNDPEEQKRLLRLELEEAERMARERLEFEERERQFLRALEMEKKKQEEEEEERRKLDDESQKELANNENASETNEDDDWEYIEEGPAEIIWKGNEIIVKKKKIRVPKKAPDILKENQESERPISNPLAPQSEAFEDYRSAKEVLESVAQQVPNFGTEQDKAHCPFHLKTGVCRFGARCSRVHFYPDKACTILIKNMYNGPGLAWEQDEGLEHTDEEVKQSFEDFYEDVHTEFLKFGELVNFKVCKNGSSHLRGNVYVHYKSLESAMLAYQSTNGRYFAGKLLTCEFINVTRWRIAICGEYMKSRFKSCSRGSACNFIHCFQNPGGDYEWADWDKPSPRYWLKKMAALFGYAGDDFTDEVGLRYHSRRSRSRDLDSPYRKSFSDEDDGCKRRCGRHSPHRGDGREARILDRELQEERRSYQDYHCFKHSETDNVDVSEGSTDDRRNVVGIKRSSKKWERERMSTDQGNRSRKVEAIKMYHLRRSRSRGLDSPHRESCSDEDDGYKRRHIRHSPHRRDDRESNNLDREMQEERRTYRDSRCFKHSETDSVDVSDGSSVGQRSVAGIKRSSKKRERERLFTDQDYRCRRVEAISSKLESAEGGVSDRYIEHKSRSSNRQKRVAQSAHECCHKKVDKFDVGKSPNGEKIHDEFHRYKDKRVTVKKIGAASLNYNSHGDSQDSEEDEHYSRSKEKSRTKDEAESSSSDSYCSDDSRLVKVKKRQQKKIRKSLRFKSKTSDVEIRCDGDSLEGYKHKQHRHHEKNPREFNIISESADGRGRLDRDDKRPQKNVRKNSRVKNRSGSTDTESGWEDDRHHRHSRQHSRHVINDNESSDGDKLGRYEKRSHKSLRKRSRSKKESELADTKRNRKRFDKEDGHKSAEHHVKEPSLSEVDSNAYRGLVEADAGNFVSNDRCRSYHSYLDLNHHSERENTDYRQCGTHNQTTRSDFMNPDVQGGILCRSWDGDKVHDSSNRDSASERDHKRLDEERMLQVNRSDEEATASGMVATNLLHISCESIDNDAKAELEKACRLAALKKLEEIRMKKDTQDSHSREPIESSKVCTEENMRGRVLEKADSSKVEIRDTSLKRRRI